jgi:acetylornithine deacetylase/succinyl-diaminopimelate desuccinylase-like protein
VSFKSISTDPAFNQEINTCILWLTNILQTTGFKIKLLNNEPSNPIIFAERITDKNLKTVFLYGHYDVQPAKFSDGWISDPFKLNITKTSLIARGAIDNKGQLLIHLYTLLELIKQDKLKYNVKLFIEGNEETGSSNLARIIKDNIKLLDCDLILISDGTISSNNPVIEISLRGHASGTLSFKTGLNKVHAGIYGNSIPNALHEISKLISKIYGRQDKLLISGFSSEKNKAIYDRNSINEIKRKLHLKKVFFNKNRNFHSKNGLDPAIIITGLTGGYTDSGFSNIVPNKAEAKINFRFPPEKDPDEYLRHFQKFLDKNIPDWLEYKWNVEAKGKGSNLILPNNLFQPVEDCLQRIYKRKVIYKHVGGSLPIITDLKELVNKPILSIPLANEDSNMHGANENFTFQYILKALKFSRELFTSSMLEKALH